MEKEILLRINLAKVNFTYVEETIAQYFTDGRKPLTIHESSQESFLFPAPPLHASVRKSD